MIVNALYGVNSNSTSKKLQCLVSTCLVFLPSLLLQFHGMVSLSFGLKPETLFVCALAVSFQVMTSP